MAMKPRALLFDAYGTLFDVHSVALREGNNFIPDPVAFSNLWRQKQLEYTWLRSLMKRYEDFWNVTEAALHSTIRELHIDATPPQLDNLMQAYLVPSIFPDVRPALISLREAAVAILSNGSPAMLQSAVRHNDLQTFFIQVISVDRVRTYKPSPEVYALGPEILRVPANEILFVSSNWWDACGAKTFGYRVCWCNRSKTAADFLDYPPDLIVDQLTQIALHIREEPHPHEGLERGLVSD
jgi:2-haloacid dehalogenase